MGTRLSCTQDPNADDQICVEHTLRPLQIQSNSSASPCKSINISPDIIFFENEDNLAADENLKEHVKLPEVRLMKSFGKFKTSDIDILSQIDEPNEFQQKRTVSFFKFSSLESRHQAYPIEFASQTHGDLWKLNNIQLNSLVHKSEDCYLWEGYNTQAKKQCTIKVNFYETSKLVNYKPHETEAILKRLSTLESQNVLDVYSFSVWESEINGNQCIVMAIIQGVAKCSLYDINAMKADKNVNWSQNQILTIIHDIYNGLVDSKKNHVNHGQLTLENVLLSEDTERILLSNFDLKLRVKEDSRGNISRSSMRNGISRFANNQHLGIDDQVKGLEAPTDKDLNDLTTIVIKLITKSDEITPIETLKANDDYKLAYYKVLEIMELIVGKKKPPQDLLNDLSKTIETRFKQRLDLGMFHSFDNTSRQDSSVDLMFTKIECYELMNNHEAAMEIYSSLIQIFNLKEYKAPTEYQKYVKCINRTIKHHLSNKDWLRANDMSKDLNKLMKKDESLRRALKSAPKEYVNYILLRANICEELNELEKAFDLYKKGLIYCNQKDVSLELYSSALKRISNLCLKKGDSASALGYLKKLAKFYESQTGYNFDKADAYLNMGNIFTKQDDLSQSGKFYLKSLENMKMGKLNDDEALLDVLYKLVDNYQKLNEDEHALKYMKEIFDIKKNSAEVSKEYIQNIQAIGNMYMKMKNYEEASKYYLLYEKSLNDAQEEDKSKYIELFVKLGDIYSNLLQHTKTMDYYHQCQKVAGDVRGLESKEFLLAKDKMANTLFKENKFSESLSIQLETISTKEKLFKDDRLYLAMALRNIGDTYFVSKDYKRAIEYYSNCHQSLESSRENNTGEYSEILLRLANTYESDGNSGKALSFLYQSSQANQKKGMGSNMESTIEMYETLGRLKENKIVELTF